MEKDTRKLYPQPEHAVMYVVWRSPPTVLLDSPVPNKLVLELELENLLKVSKRLLQPKLWKIVY